MKNLFIYDAVAALNRDEHRNLKLAPANGSFEFARDTHAVPLTMSELPHAVLDYPCVFAEVDGGHVLVALMGLQEHQNLFVQADGSWAQGAYVPAFVRRYPFMLAEAENGGALTLCLDRAHAGFNATEGEPLFDANGREMPWLEEFKRFLVALRQELLATGEFARRMNELGLLEAGSIDVSMDGKATNALTGVKSVDEGRLRALDAATLKDLSDRGWLALAHAHMLSMHQLPRLSRRLDARRREENSGRDAGATH